MAWYMRRLSLAMCANLFLVLKGAQEGCRDFRVVVQEQRRVLVVLLENRMHALAKQKLLVPASHSGETPAYLCPKKVCRRVSLRWQRASVVEGPLPLRLRPHPVAMAKVVEAGVEPRPFGVWWEETIPTSHLPTWCVAYPADLSLRAMPVTLRGMAPARRCARTAW